jgi:preprotein translocase subunit SecA
MDRFKLPEDQPMEAGILSKQIETAQKKVEEQNFVARKNVLKYDDVMNVQRQKIYEQRRAVLEGQDLSEEIKSWIEEVVESVVAEHTSSEFQEEWDLEELVVAMRALYDTEVTLDELREDLGEISREALVEEFTQDALDEYAAKEESLEQVSPGIMRDLERYIVLQVVDQRWREHLENMDYLREGVHLRAMAQKDPLVEYRHEGHIMFEELGGNIRREVLSILFHAEIEPADAPDLQLEQDGSQGNGRLSYEHESLAGADAMAAAGTATSAGGLTTAAGSVATTVKKSEHENIGRNEPCWCGSGKKFKKCHGA